MCKYCKADYKNVEIDTKKSDFEVEIDEDGLNIYFQQGNMYENYSDSVVIKINYCPMCGRSLTDE